ncbi:gamma-glutamyltransferase [Oxalicibacterium faecigallinarum]|uniref:Glutathione hydrolase proenzyme n=1 Tax=Oxalicibacterium faecigallinarum TaxID=573741 RepID=A0A8J3F191_9BURK|nr:gamma-glutamyltransferase [Oxalicibacterium faecigallinarum]GGI17152.1 gamma-glutamyltransferase [Oxalicibacterium faecigallinarum]
MRSTRPVSYAEHGMVATAHYLGTGAALDVLKEGGTAVDAAICAAATLSVVLPHMIGIGGDAFWLIHDARSNSLSALNGSGTCGRNISLNDYQGLDAIPHRGPRAAITVPGAVDSWGLAHARFGTLPLSRLLEPAIRYAREGVAVTQDISQWIADDADVFRQDPGSADIFLKNGQAYRPGERLKQTALADTLEGIARHGTRHFYEQTAHSIVDYLKQQGGLLTIADFQQYHAKWVAPISTSYRDVQVYQVPPPSQGIAGLLILNFLNGIDFSGIKYDSPEYYNAMIQAIKWAFNKRDRYLTDPDFYNIPIEKLLDPALANAERDEWLNDTQRTHENRAGGSDTTFISIADRYGNAVGLVQSLYFDFGACVTDPGSGVLMQNRGSFFSLQPDHPNVLKAGKQSASTLMSGMAFKNGKPFMVYGTQGGEVQPQTQTSVLTRVVDFGLNVQQAIDAPRVLYGRSWGDDGNRLLLESAVPASTFTALQGQGHPAESAQWPYPRMGTAQAVRLPGPWSAFFEGGADPRGEGIALGF